MFSRDKKSNTAQDDLEYFTSLFQKYSRLMFFTAERFINNGVDVDDIVQESFAKLMAHEVGHTLGLSHIIANIATVLMEPYATTTYAYHGIYGPTSYDIAGVVAVGY